MKKNDFKMGLIWGVKLLKSDIERGEKCKAGIEITNYPYWKKKVHKELKKWQKKYKRKEY